MAAKTSKLGTERIVQPDCGEAVMLDHIGLAVSDLAISRRFYVVALAPLSLGIVMEVTQEQTGKYAGAGFGAGNKPFFWIGTGDQRSGPLHVAFTASTRAHVDAFYQAALSAGGRDHGPPGVRAHYHPNYYGAFVLDPDGNNVEAVCHGPS
jgi:catechol 2,3-dioxygenase-like lactoylglutathione lyase family enzyme